VPRPAWAFAPPAADFYDWLAANRVDEMLPATCTIIVAGGRLAFSAFQFKRGRRGDRWDAANIVVDGRDDAVRDWRDVKLRVPVTDAFREACAAGKATLLE
jgi:hypothetical protein